MHFELHKGIIEASIGMLLLQNPDSFVALAILHEPLIKHQPGKRSRIGVDAYSWGLGTSKCDDKSENWPDDLEVTGDAPSFVAFQALRAVSCFSNAENVIRLAYHSQQHHEDTIEAT